MKKDFRRIVPQAARVILLDAGARVIAAFSEKTSTKAAKELGELGVIVREHAEVTGIDSTGVTVKVGHKTERIAARTVVWAAGMRTAGIAEIVARRTGAGTDPAGRVEVGPDLTVAGYRLSTAGCTNATLYASGNLTGQLAKTGLFVDTIQTAPETFTAIVLLGVLAVVLDAIVQSRRHSPHAPEGVAVGV